MTLEGISTANKITVSRDFGGNKYSKNSWIMYIINDYFDEYTN